MGITTIYQSSDDSPATVASDGGICRTDDVRYSPASTTIPFDVVQQPELSLAFGLLVLGTYANPDASQKNRILTPSQQEIWVYTQTVSCSEGNQIESARLLSDALINGAWFMADKSITLHENLSLASGILRFDTEILPDIWFRAGTEVFYDDTETLTESAHFTSGVLRDAETFYGIDFAAGTDAAFHASGHFRKARLSQDTKINGIWFAKNHEVEFDDAGHLIRGTLLTPTMFQGIEWPSYAEVEFHANGAFFAGILPASIPSKLTKYGQITLVNGTRAEWNDQGMLSKGTPIEDVRMQVGDKIIWLKKMHAIECYDDGVIKSGYLRDPVTLNGVDLEAGPISFYQNGAVHIALLAHDTKFDFLKVDVTFMQHHEVEFDDEGHFVGGDAKDNVVLQEHLDDDGKPIVLKARKYVSFFADGTFQSGRLLHETSVKNLPLKAGSKIKFDAERNLKRGHLAYDTPIFPDVYGDTVVFAADTECGYNEKNEFYGTLKYDVAFKVQLADKTVVLTAQAGGELSFNANSDQIQGGILKIDVTLWPNVTFQHDKWFGVDLSHSEYFTDDPDEADYIGGVLKNPLSLDGHKLPADKYCEFYIDGKIKGYMVLKPFVVDATLYPELILGDNRWVEFYPGGTQIKGGKLAEDGEPFPDLYTDPNNPLILAKDTWAEFDADGILTGGKLAQDFTIINPLVGEMDLKQGEWVDLGEDGRILGGRLRDDVELFLPNFENLVLAQNQWVDFDASGRLIGGKLAEDAIYRHPIFGAIQLQAGQRIEFNEDGTLKGSVLADPVTIQNSRYGQIDLLEDEWFELHPTGEFKSGTLENELYIINNKAGDFFIVDGTEATFYPAETLEYGVLSDAITLQTPVGAIDLQKLTEVELDPEEEVASGFVDHQYIIGGDKYRVGAWVDFTRYASNPE